MANRYEEDILQALNIVKKWIKEEEENIELSLRTPTRRRRREEHKKLGLVLPPTLVQQLDIIANSPELLRKRDYKYY